MSVEQPTISCRAGRAYRDGVLVCAGVQVAVLRDARIAPEPAVPPRIRVRFAERLDGALRGDLERLVEARGARGERLAGTLAPLEVVWDEPEGPYRVVGRLDPPRAQHCGRVEEVSFPVRAAEGDAGQVGAGAPSAAERRVCVACEAPAAYYNEDADEDLCVACGIYLAGQHHGKAAIAREWLSDAIAELIAATLTREHIEAMADGELEGVYRPSGPDIAHAQDPRPWVRYLLDPIR